MYRLFKRSYWFVYKRLWPVDFARKLGVQVGRRCRLINVDYGSEPYLISLGDHVSATKVHFVTHDGGVWVLRHEFPDLDVIAPIRVGNNVFFGIGCVVLPGVTIGDDVVIGAGSVVSRDIPSRSVAAGVPARVISSLDEYRSKVIERGISTKQLTKSEKREALLTQFSPR